MTTNSDDSQSGIIIEAVLDAFGTNTAVEAEVGDPQVDITAETISDFSETDIAIEEISDVSVHTAIEATSYDYVHTSMETISDDSQPNTAIEAITDDSQPSTAIEAISDVSGTSTAIEATDMNAEVNKYEEKPAGKSEDNLNTSLMTAISDDFEESKFLGESSEREESMICEDKEETAFEVALPFLSIY